MADVVVACLGDSITEGSPYWDSRRGSGEHEGQWEHWAALRHPGIAFRNHGIWGQRTNEIAQGLDVASAAANLTALAERGLALGLPVAVCDVLPWNNGWPDGESPIRELNALLADFRVPLLAFHDTLEDPGRPGRMKDEWTNEDGDHPSIAGYRRLGELAFHP